MEKIKIDKQFSLKVWDFLKGMYMAVGLPIIAIVLEQLQVGNFNLDWKGLGALAVANIALYLAKNFFAPTKVVIEQPTQTTIEVARRDPDKPILYPPGTPIHPSPGPTVPPNPKP